MKRNMMKKIFIGVGVIIALPILLAALFSESKSALVQNAEQNTQQPVSKATTFDEVITDQPTIKTGAPKAAATKVATQPTPAAVTPSSQSTYYSVAGVVDGDTIKISMNGSEETLRLIGMDTPETVDPRKQVECFGKEASNKAKELLSGENVRIEADATQNTRDKYGRLLVYVYRDDGVLYNKYMIEHGYAYEYTYDVAYKYQAEFRVAQKSAQDNQRGLWSPNTCNGTATETTGSASQPQTSPASTQVSGKFYTSSHYSAKYYYPTACDGWQSLSPSYLKSLDSIEALLAAYPSRIRSPQCQ